MPPGANGRPGRMPGRGGGRILGEAGAGKRRGEDGDDWLLHVVFPPWFPCNRERRYATASIASIARRALSAVSVGTSTSTRISRSDSQRFWSVFFFMFGHTAQSETG